MPTANVNGELWGARAKDWTERQEPTVAPLWQAMLEAAKVGPGTRLLDVACGGGGAAQLAKERGGIVTGIDASEALVTIASERVQGNFVVGDIESLPFPDEAFDVVTCTNGLQYAEDKVRAACELRRVVVPSGVVVVGMWAEAAKNEMAPVMKAVGRLTGAPPPVLDLSARETLIDLLRQAGLEAVADEDVPCEFRYENKEAYLTAQRSAGVLENAARKAGEDRVREALEEIALPFTRPDGSIVMHNTMRYVLTKPAP